jgi:transmembrane sensor
MEKKNKKEKANWDLLAKYIAGEANEDEKTTMESWINESEENFQELKECQRLIENIGLYYESARFDETNALKFVQTKINAESVKTNQSIHSGRKVYLSLIKYAAIVLVVIATGFFTYWLGFRKTASTDMNQIVSADKEVLREIALPDGSFVTLNGNTTILYPQQFQGKTREVEIRGEAFFDVKPNPDRPFIITAGKTKITVLGTSFNVCAYPGAETVEVVVETGKVRVDGQSASPNPKIEVLLTKGEKATFSKKDKTLQKKTNDDPNYIGWKTQNLVYTKSPLGYVFENLEKTYHVEIEVVDPEIKKLVLSAQFNNKPVDFILDVIRLTFNLKLSVENTHYVINKRNS